MNFCDCVSCPTSFSFAFTPEAEDEEVQGEDDDEGEWDDEYAPLDLPGHRLERDRRLGYTQHNARPSTPDDFDDAD